MSGNGLRLCLTACVPVSTVKETLLCFTLERALLEPSFQARKDVN